jgi:hypothetical protein
MKAAIYGVKKDELLVWKLKNKKKNLLSISIKV